jgi:hypothetical protein
MLAIALDHEFYSTPHQLPVMPMLEGGCEWFAILNICAICKLLNISKGAHHEQAFD